MNSLRRKNIEGEMITECIVFIKCLGTYQFTS